MLESILKTTSELKEEIKNRISSDEYFIERELLISTYYKLEDIQRTIEKGVNPQIIKYYETFNKDVRPKIDQCSAPLPANCSTR